MRRYACAVKHFPTINHTCYFVSYGHHSVYLLRFVDFNACAAIVHYDDDDDDVDDVDDNDLVL